MCSVQSNLLFLYYVVFSVISVPQCILCVSRIHSVQCQSIAASVQFYSVQCKQCSESIASVQFLKRSVYNYGRVCSIHSQWCSVLAGLQSTAFMVCLLLFSISIVQRSSIQWSVGFRVYSVQYQFSVCSVQGVYCSVGHSPSVLFSVCSVQSTGCSPRVCHVHHCHVPESTL